MIQITKKEGKKALRNTQREFNSDIIQDKSSQFRDCEDFTGCLHASITSLLTIQHILGVAAEKS